MAILFCNEETKQIWKCNAPMKQLKPSFGVVINTKWKYKIVNCSNFIERIVG